MSQVNFCTDDSMLFSDVYQDQVGGMTVAFPSPKAFRVGSYSGSDCERQFQSFPTPPDSPVLAELTAPASNRQTKMQVSGPMDGYAPSPAGGYHADNLPLSGSCLQGMEVDLISPLLDDLLHDNLHEQLNQQLCGSTYQQNSMPNGTEILSKSDFVDNCGQYSPASPMNLTSSLFNTNFSDAFDDYNIPSPAPSPSSINDSDIFADLPNLDDLTLVSEFAKMEAANAPRQQHGPFGISSSGEESDPESEGSYSLTLDELQGTAFNPMNVQVPSSVLAHPPPLYHDHHNIQHYHQYHHQQQQQQQQTHQPHPQSHYAQHPYNAAGAASSGRTHNYQCRTMHTTLNMLDTKDGIVTQEVPPPPQQTSCGGPIRKAYRSRPRKQSVTSSDDGCSDEEHMVTATSTAVNGGNGRTSPNRNRGRGRREAMKGNHLWEFIRDLLKSDSYCPKFIRWEDRESGVFRFVNSEAVATMWGRKKNNPQMTYEKLSRAMRYYYKREILERVDGRRLVYKFGKNAEGWREAAGLQ